MWRDWKRKQRWHLKCLVTCQLHCALSLFLAPHVEIGCSGDIEKPAGMGLVRFAKSRLFQVGFIACRWWLWQIFDVVWNIKVSSISLLLNLIFKAGSQQSACQENLSSSSLFHLLIPKGNRGKVNVEKLNCPNPLIAVAVACRVGGCSKVENRNQICKSCVFSWEKAECPSSKYLLGANMF